MLFLIIDCIIVVGIDKEVNMRKEERENNGYVVIASEQSLRHSDCVAIPENDHFVILREQSDRRISSVIKKTRSFPFAEFTLSEANVLRVRMTL